MDSTAAPLDSGIGNQEVQGRGIGVIGPNGSGKTHVPLLKEMRTNGYEVHIYYLWPHGVDLALARVANRVAAGGHDVPAATVRRRFERGLHNLFHLYRPLVDSWVLFDNSGDEPRVIAKETAGVLRVLDATLFDEITKSAGIL
jgi:predicted ABC-type ATPase